jgi:hypothetical protein
VTVEVVEDRALTGELEALERLSSTQEEPPGVVSFESQTIDHIDFALTLSSILQTPKVLAKGLDMVAQVG